MLDAYIIDRIRKERERDERDGAFIPLHIDSPLPERKRPGREAERDEETDERGTVIVDFLF